MDDLIYSTPAYTTVKCPFKKCSKPIHNTPRYLTRTRQPTPASRTSTSKQSGVAGLTRK